VVFPGQRDEDQVRGKDRANVDLKDRGAARFSLSFKGWKDHDILMICCLIEIEVFVIESLENLEL
jgi:hypothetical protein